MYNVEGGRVHEDRADALFHALSDRTRRDIMRRVLAGEHSVSALAAKYDLSFAAVQKHVAVLQKSGLLVKRRSALLDTIQEVGADHLLFSAEYPFEDTRQAATWFDRPLVQALPARRHLRGQYRRQELLRDRRPT